MKNRGLVLLLLLATIATSVQAQYSDYYYHRVGDTIEWRSEIGYYAWWEFERYYANNMHLVYSLRDFGEWVPCPPRDIDSAEVVQRYYTPVPLRVVGLAGCCVRGHGPAGWNHLDVYVYDTGNYQNYFVIYDATPDGFPLVGRLKWSPFDPYRVLDVELHTDRATYHDSSCCKYSPEQIYIPIHEYYFDSAITVTDSFYVGGTFYGEPPLEGISPVYDTSLRTSYGCVSAEAIYSYGHPCVEDQYVYNDGYCQTEPWLYKSKFNNHTDSSNRSFPESPWVWHISQSPILIYPLIEVDTTVPPESVCIPVANVQVTTSGTSATVTWDGFPNYSSIFLRYGKRSQPHAQWNEIDVTGNTLYTLTDLDPVSIYSVILKARCEVSKKETPWSDTVTFYVADTSGGGTGGIEDATLLSRLTFLKPNPARDEVTVTSSFSLKAVDIWTIDGVMVYHGEKMGHETVLDISWLRAGTYIVAIHTHNGTTHKKLVVN